MISKESLLMPSEKCSLRILYHSVRGRLVSAEIRPSGLSLLTVKTTSVHCRNDCKSEVEKFFILSGNLASNVERNYNGVYVTIMNTYIQLYSNSPSVRSLSLAGPKRTVFGQTVFSGESAYCRTKHAWTQHTTYYLNDAHHVLSIPTDFQDLTTLLVNHSCLKLWLGKSSRYRTQPDAGNMTI